MALWSMNCFKNNRVTTRDSGIELLRIIAALAVIVLHYNNGRAFVFAKGTFNYHILILLESLSIGAVDIFIMISGFFLCTKNERNIRKSFSLLLQLILFQQAYFFLSLIIGNHGFDLNLFIKGFFPTNYFVTLYIVLYFVSPYINRIFRNMSREGWNSFLIIAFCFFSIYPITVDVINELTGEKWFGLSPIGAWGSQQGFTIVNFILAYCLGAAVRFSDISSIRGSKCFLIMMCCSLLIIFIWAEINEKMSLNGLRSAWCYHNPFVLIFSVSCLVFFLRMKFKNTIINELSKAAFTCYLFHPYCLYYMQIGRFVRSSPVIMCCHLLGSVILVFLLSWIVFKLYSFVVEPLLNRISKNISYPE